MNFITKRDFVETAWNSPSGYARRCVKELILRGENVSVNFGKPVKNCKTGSQTIRNIFLLPVKHISVAGMLRGSINFLKPGE